MDEEEKDKSRKVSIEGNVSESIIILGDGNTVTQEFYRTSVLHPIDVEKAFLSPVSLTKEEYKQKRLLIDNVKYSWIDGVLKRSLHNQILLELGLEERFNAVRSPISGAEEFPDLGPNVFPEGTQAINVFEKLGVGRTLLILGEPGSGKTITLLKIAQSLIDKIDDSLGQPVPVILNLSSWGRKRQTITEWLVEEINDIFKVSRTLSKKWIKEEQLILCLDGLDEVATQYQDACVQSINRFVRKHSLTEVVVSSRIRDYETLSTKLTLRSALYVQPLTYRQVDQYIAQAGDQLTALSAFLNCNKDLKSLASSPLILSIMSLAYKDSSIDEFSHTESTDLFLKNLFDSYIKRMLQRRSSRVLYSSAQTKYWLVWISRQMVIASQTVFLIENLQPSGLETNLQKNRYLVRTIFVGTISGTVMGALIIMLLSLQAYMISIVAGYPQRIELWMLLGLLVGALSGCFLGLTSSVLAEFIPELFSQILGKRLRDIEPTETLRWSWTESGKSFKKGFVIGSAIGAAFILFMLLTEPLSFDPGLSAISGFLLVIAIVGVAFGFPSSLFGGITSKGVQKSKSPNQGIWKSIQHSFFTTLVSGYISGVIAACLSLLIIGPDDVITVIQTERYLAETLSPEDLAATPFDNSAYANVMMATLFFSLFIGLMSWLFTGGAAFVRHISLRAELTRAGYAPKDYAQFLDFATERLLLQKVGGGYIFIHRMLLEHFAKMDLDRIKGHGSRKGDTFGKNSNHKRPT